MPGKKPKARHPTGTAPEPVPSQPAAVPNGKKKRAASKGSWLNASEGWKSVDVADDFLLGMEEGGFAGLEVLENCVITDADLAGVEVMQSETKGKQTRSNKKKRNATLDAQDTDDQTLDIPSDATAGASKRRKAAATQQDGDVTQTGAANDDVQALKAQLAALKQENRVLKAAAGVDTGKVDTAAVEGVVGETSAAKRKRKLEVYRAKMAALRQLKREKQKVQKQKQKNQDRNGAKATAESSVADDTDEEEGKEEGGEGTPRQQQTKGHQVPAQEQFDALPKVDVTAWRLFALHPLIEKAVAIQGFSSPTEIQSAVLPAVLRDRMDVIGAAQTGSGKTLAFGLPIMQALLQEREVSIADGIPHPHQDKLRALIMAPTRELALQVQSHLAAIGKVCGVRVAAIVGGIAHVKQERVLHQNPAVVVATPGRLWELLRDHTSPHLADMTGLRFLVLDEADRMVAKGHFQELSSILALVPHPCKGGKTQTYDTDFHDTLAAVNEMEAKKKLKGKGKGKKGGDEEREEQQEVEEGAQDANDATAVEEREGLEVEEEQGEEEEKEAPGQVEEEDGVSPSNTDADAGAADRAGAGRHRNGKGNKGGSRGGDGSFLQTLVFSATLTLPTELRKRLRRGGGGAGGGTDLDSLMDRVPFRGTPRIVDLSSKRKLAAGVNECMVQCLSGTDRDAVLYYLLARHPGRVLVFVNAVSALRRVAALLKLLGLPAQSLHAQQQQRQRLKALDTFKSNEQAVLVATDVAARGLDVRNIRMVIHYQLPATIDTYIHRSGRTARGHDAEGLSVALVAPDEAMRWGALVKAMDQEKPPPLFPIDATLMPQVVERLKLAIRVDEEERHARKTSAEEGWERRLEEEMGLGEGDEREGEDSARGKGKGKGKGGKAKGPGINHHAVDDDEEDDAVLTNKRAQARKASELASLKRQLATMLSQPLTPHMSRSYFTGGAAAGVTLSSAPGRGGGGTTVAATAGKGKKGKEGTFTVDAVALGAATAQAVAAATRLQSKPSGAANKPRLAGVQKKKKVQKRLSVEQLARQELARRKAVKQAKKKGVSAPTATGGAGGRRGGIVVIPPAVSRDTQGQDGLAALKRKLQAVS